MKLYLYRDRGACYMSMKKPCFFEDNWGEVWFGNRVDRSLCSEAKAYLIPIMKGLGIKWGDLKMHEYYEINVT